MYNPDFWELKVDHSDLERISEERGIWFETLDDRLSRYELEERHIELSHYVSHNLLGTLTRKQREAFLLYFQYGKTQQEIAEILGMSRRVVSQHLFGICRNGKHVGGAIKKSEASAVIAVSHPPACPDQPGVHPPPGKRAGTNARQLIPIG